MVFEFKITIERKDNSKEKAELTAKNLVELKNLISDKDLADLVKLLKKNPSVIDIARQYLGK